MSSTYQAESVLHFNCPKCVATDGPKMTAKVRIQTDAIGTYSLVPGAVARCSNCSGEFVLSLVPVS